MSTVEVVANDGSAPSDKVILRVGSSTCGVLLFGATVFSWVPEGHGERLWLSTIGRMDRSMPVRGGIPVVFPQFAGQGSLPQHGLVRGMDWSLQSTSTTDEQATAVFTVSDNAETRALWNHGFTCTYTVELTRSGLAVTLKATNTNPAGGEPWSFTHCLHTYFRTADVRRCAITGLKGLPFADKADGMAEKVQQEESLVLDSATIPTDGYYIDRIYRNPGRSSDPSAMRHVAMTDSGEGGSDPAYRLDIRMSDAAFPDTVIFNPWKEGKKGDKGPDFDDEGYNHMLCIEPTVSTEPQVLQPGQEWVGRKEVVISAL